MMRRGFTLPELLLALVLGGMIIGVLHRVILSQNGFYRQARFTVERHEALRTAMAVLGPEVRGANLAEGDIELLGSDAFRVRSPEGFGIVCGVDEQRRHLSLTDVHGRLDGGPGSSLQVYHPEGWRDLSVQRANPQGRTDAGCALEADGEPELRAQMDGDVTGIPVGAPVRAVTTFLYALGQAQGAWWLTRSGQEGEVILAGPIPADGTGLAFSLLDNDGNETEIQAEAVSVRLRVIVDPGQGLGLEGLVPKDTLFLALLGRNR